MSPKILLATTNRWFSAARLAIALKSAHCTVDVVCPTGHPVALTSAFRRIYPYRGLAPLRSFQSAAIAAAPDIVIPCDDLARTHLREIYEQVVENQPGSTLRALLERSLGDPSLYDCVAARSQLIALAHELEANTPETIAVADKNDLQARIAQIGLPVVLKSDGTSGGVGVHIVNSEAEAMRAFDALNTPPAFLRVVKRTLIDRDRTLIIPFLKRRRPVINLQRFLPFPDATIAVACWQGEVLASSSVQVLRTWKPRGPASVVRIVDNSDMRLAAQKLVHRLNLSGLCGFDFVVDPHTEKAYLIEMNPRATQTCHLPLDADRNLPAALAARISGKAPILPASVTDNDVIALFPLEWQNDAASPYLRTGYHDVPWEEPKLVEACVQSRMRNGGRFTYDNLNRILTFFQRNRP